MSEHEKEQNTQRTIIWVEEVQKTIDMGIREGRINPEAIPRPSMSQTSTRFFRTTTQSVQRGMLHIWHLLSYSSVQKIPRNAQDTDTHDSLTSLSHSENMDIAELNLGLIDSDFQQEELIASGGQADVINAKDKQVGRTVAVKSLRNDYKGNPNAASNLIQEALLTARLEHPSIIPVYRLCRDPENDLHIVMKKIRGKTLSQYLSEIRAYYCKSKLHIFEERASLSRRLDIFLDICNGLGYAHSQKAVHCDLKPDNIMIGFHHETYIIDWGIAKIISQDGTVPGAKQISGTPNYIAPEVVFGLDYDRRADIFAMGAILFEMVTLRQAFSGKEIKDLLENICTGNMNPIKHLYGAGIDKALIHIIRKATASHPDERYQTVEALAEDIRRYRSGLEISAKPDNIFQYAIRWMLIHKRLTRWTLQIFIAAAIGIVGFNIYEKMQFELLQKRRETSLNNAYTQSLIIALEINNQLNKIEQIVRVLASETAFILDHHGFEEKAAPPAESEDSPFISFRDLRSETPPASSILSMHYNSRIDFSNLSFINSGKISNNELKHYLLTLQPFKRQIVSLFILSCVDKNPFVGEASTRPENMEKSNYSLLWLCLNFANGLHLRYPAAESYDESFDARRCSWYIQAWENPNVVIWRQPHLEAASGNKVTLTAAKAVTSPKQEFLGVACAEIAIDEIRRIIEDDTSNKYFKKMLLLPDGRILINTANPGFIYKNDASGKLSLPQFHHAKLFELMKQKKFGFERVQENGRETFYIYTYLEQMKWYYIVRVDQDTIEFQQDWKAAAAQTVSD